MATRQREFNTTEGSHATHQREYTTPRVIHTAPLHTGLRLRRARTSLSVSPRTRLSDRCARPAPPRARPGLSSLTIPKTHASHSRGSRAGHGARTVQSGGKPLSTSALALPLKASWLPWLAPRDSHPPVVYLLSRVLSRAPYRSPAPRPPRFTAQPTQTPVASPHAIHRPRVSSPDPHPQSSPDSHPRHPPTRRRVMLSLAAASPSDSHPRRRLTRQIVADDAGARCTGGRRRRHSRPRHPGHMHPRRCGPDEALAPDSQRG
ncbi:hypothetical protein IEO21_06286 [Rhodonia placenta]|uniref:Uncharacterized protein n=1 Tax=Rhodonia placenta TaxID=104341 RepID=A0A8H7U1A8_9APHY|nr:hypothetical protein IEO21_06286 [Postia placenta]